MSRRKNIDFHEAIVGVRILFVGFQVNGRMSDGVFTIFIYPRVFGSDVHLPNLLSLGGFYAVIKRGRASSSTKEGFTWMEWCG